VAEQTQLFKTQTVQKTHEHAELAKILKEYRVKYAEFEKATKKTKDYYKNFEREIRTLDQRKKDLTAQKKALQGQ
jgi:septal ring factor EnvC (AmiA/AmiB activator)